ncbi:MAG: TolC family protein [Gammaproteobacteria bacterium]|nr:MAG: TolC family protein [Gammaproteobacteria bacterium]
MYKKTVFAISVCLLSIAGVAQTSDITGVLQEIESNNKELQAYADLMESRQLALVSGNNLPDPVASAYYMPWGDHPGGSYTEFEITQSFEFPTVYGTRRDLIAKQKGQMAIEYDMLRQDVLLPAKKYLLEVIYLNKRMAVEEMRSQKARQVYDQVQELFDKEQVGILEVNKAKIAWMQEHFKVDQIENERENLLLLLKNMNGGNDVTFVQPAMAEDLNLDALDSIWEHRQAVDPALKKLKQQEVIALQQIELSKTKALPNLTAGFNYQGVSGVNYSGVYGGLSIPLWSSKNTVKAAEAHYLYQQSYSDVQLLQVYAEFRKQYNAYQILLRKFLEYQDTLGNLSSDALLLQSYELGEISFMDYYIELQFYRQAYDAMLEMENQLHQLNAEILKHQL